MNTWFSSVIGMKGVLFVSNYLYLNVWICVGVLGMRMEW